MKKAHKKWIFMGLLFMVLSYMVYISSPLWLPHHIWIPSPFKAINPSDPEFRVESFEFNDYRTEGGVTKALDKIFPIGTDQGQVDQLLVGQMGLLERKPFFEKDDTSFKQTYTIYYTQDLHYKSWLVTRRYVKVIYNSDDKVSERISFGYEGKGVRSSGRLINEDPNFPEPRGKIGKPYELK